MTGFGTGGNMGWPATAGATWADIGRAVGLSRQAARDAGTTRGRTRHKHCGEDALIVEGSPEGVESRIASINGVVFPCVTPR
jgi:hypothetical protein